MLGPDTRPSLLIQLRDPAQQEAWGEFVAIYEPLVYRMARSKGFQHADAADLGQEVLAAVAKSIDRFDPYSQQGSFRGWLFRIARNLMINLMSRQKDPPGCGDTANLDLLSQLPDEADNGASEFSLEYRREVFRWAADRVQSSVSAHAWQAFWITSIEGVSYESAAKQLNRTPGAVRILRCRVLAKLRNEVRQFDD